MNYLETDMMFISKEIKCYVCDTINEHEIDHQKYR